MGLLDDLKKIGEELGAETEEKKGVYTMTALIAERKAFLSKKRLEYIAKFRIDEGAKELRFTEMLKESGSGFSSSSGMDEETAGFGFKSGVYKTGFGGNEGTIEEQSRLFGKDYQYKFDYAATRKKIEAKALEAGYRFSYQVTPIGL
jgi:UDP-N-acetylglucosamine 2-epimerase